MVGSGLRFERMTPGVVLGLGMFFFALTLFVHLDSGRAPTAPLSEGALSGRRVFQRHNCAACHQLYGLGGFLGPDLTNVVSRRGQGYVRAVLLFGMGNMPTPALTETEVNQTLEYLSELDGSGHYPLTRWPPPGLPN